MIYASAKYGGRFALVPVCPFAVAPAAFLQIPLVLVPVIPVSSLSVVVWDPETPPFPDSELRPSLFYQYSCTPSHDHDQDQ